MRILKSYFLLLMFLPSLMAFGEDISFRLQFHNQRVYYPGSPIWIRASIRNNSGSDYIFSLADQSERNVALFVKTMTNQPVPVSENYMLRTASNEPIFYRLIKLLPGEEYSFLIDLNDFVSLEEPGHFMIQGQFIPTVNQSQARIDSNALRVSLRPSSQSRQFIDSIDIQTGEILEREALPPDQVIQFLLESRQHNQWNRVFLYLNIEALFLRSSDRRARFLNSNETTRAQLLDDFKENIRMGRIDANVSTVPDEFSILQVSHTATHATVLTRQVYYRHQFNEIKEFTWTLERNNGIWLVTGFSVQNLGTQ
ncbi:hypothetical protein PVA44_04880 [Entomospira nematocerorum]|uniref:Uncharacterized protein n=1 Tax=Entomospira nematocerorum TaxID=2719987 RepID=A0A968GE64_9SPIO|nr:hypothetical protein [Entomospira nematocera]NIZ46645.1 hypothetical protein [Entomospira nematocera]WDI33557.1 hypothetical protein PVA44_04880 [Entomospira nematocera]